MRRPLLPTPRLGPEGAGWASWARWLEPGRWRRRPEAAAPPPPRPGAGGDPNERPRPPMRLFVGWLCLSLASVWLARRMWTLRSPLTRSLYVNMTSGPGGPAAAAAGGRKENHQVRGRPGSGPGPAGAGAWRPGLPALCPAIVRGAAARKGPPGRRPAASALQKVFPTSSRPGAAAATPGRPARARRRLLFPDAGGERPPVPPWARVWAPRSPALFPGPGR